MPTQINPEVRFNQPPSWPDAMSYHRPSSSVWVNTMERSQTPRKAQITSSTIVAGLLCLNIFRPKGYHRVGTDNDTIYPSCNAAGNTCGGNYSIGCGSGKMGGRSGPSSAQYVIAEVVFVDVVIVEVVIVGVEIVEVSDHGGTSGNYSCTCQCFLSTMAIERRDL